MSVASHVFCWILKFSQFVTLWQVFQGFSKTFFPKKVFLIFSSFLEEGDCFQQGMFYSDPVKMEGTERTVELAADACQQRCQVIEAWRKRF